MILGAAAVLFATGVVLAVAQPGDLGDGDDDTAGPAETTTTTTEPDEPGGDEGETDGGTTSTTETSTTTTAVAGGDDTTSTTQPTSGIGADGAGRVGDGIADTGHESMLAAGLALLAVGLAAHRAAHAA